MSFTVQWDVHVCDEIHCTVGCSSVTRFTVQWGVCVMSFTVQWGVRV